MMAIKEKSIDIAKTIVLVIFTKQKSSKAERKATKKAKRTTAKKEKRRLSS